MNPVFGAATWRAALTRSIARAYGSRSDHMRYATQTEHERETP